MLCAAISYVEDQNGPSRPYLLEIQDDATADKIDEILISNWRNTFFDEESEEVVEDPDIIDGAGYGDLQVILGSESIFITIPDAHRDRIRALFGLKPQPH